MELENGNIPQKSVNKIKTAVQQAAPKARQFFSGQDFLAALKDYLFPVMERAKSAEDLMNPAESFAQFYSGLGNLLDYAPVSVGAAVFQLQKNLALNVKDGPHAMELSCSSISLAELLSSSARAVLDTQAYLPAEERGTGDVAGLVAEEFAAEAYKQIQKSGSKNGIVLDVDGLIVDGRPRGYEEYFEGFRWGDTIESLENTLDKLPDIAALPLPKAGLMRGNNRGTTVNFKLNSGWKVTGLTGARFKAESTSMFKWKKNKAVKFLDAGTIVFSIELENAKNGDPFGYILIVNRRR